MPQTPYTVITNQSYRDRWNDAVQHPLQSWEWGEFRSSIGQRIIRVARIRENSLTHPFLMTLHNIPYTPYTIGYIGRSGMPDSEALASLRAASEPYSCIATQWEPDVESKSPGVRIPEQFHPSVRPLFPRYTFTLHLTPPLHELLASFHPKTRYNIRLAEKKGVTVREDSSDNAFATYLTLTHETTKRQRYFAHSDRYHTQMWQTLSRAGIAKLFIAEYQHIPLAAWIMFVWNNRMYYPYGASSRLHKEVMAPHLMMWSVIRWAKTHGIRTFDMWGAMGPDPDIHDPWYGFHRFKTGFHPNHVEFIGSFDDIIHPNLYRIFTVANSIRWNILARIR